MRRSSGLEKRNDGGVGKADARKKKLITTDLATLVIYGVSPIHGLNYGRAKAERFHSTGFQDVRGKLKLIGESHQSTCSV